MQKRIHIIFHATWIIVAAAIVNPCFATEEYGKWGVTAQGGFVEFYLQNGKGDHFAITCNGLFVPASKEEYNRLSISEKTQISNIMSSTPMFDIEINGKTYTADDKDVKIIIDNSKILLSQIKTNDLIRLLRKGKKMIIGFLGGRTSKFSINGASEAFKDVSCEHFDLPKDWK